MPLFHARPYYLLYYRLVNRSSGTNRLERRWRGSSKRATVDEHKQIFPRRQITKEIARRVRTVEMEAAIMEDLGITPEMIREKRDDGRLASSMSVIASRYLLENTSKFTGDLAAIKTSNILERNRKVQEEEVAFSTKRVKESARDLRLPLGNFSAVEYSPATTTEMTKSGAADDDNTTSDDVESAYDRGFHVEGDLYKDEYVAGTLTDLPAEQELKTDTFSSSPVDDSSAANADTADADATSGNAAIFTRIDRQELKRMPPYRLRYGPADAVEEVELLHPTQEPLKMEDLPRNLKRKKVILDDTGFGEETENESWKQYYGTANRSVKPVSDIDEADADHRCTGCGATFHCQDSSLPGFLPASLYLEKKEIGDFSGTPCRRCYLLKRHNFLVNVSVSPIDYERVLGRLRTIENVLIVLLVDMTDFPGCIYPRLPDFIGHGKPTIVVGTKVDLLPPDAKSGYIRHFHRCLRRAVVEIGYAERMNLLDVHLVSAKTGYGIEELVSFIFSKWAGKGDVYLIGCTNTGKSTLFNALLQSDLCKVRAVDLVDRATTSLWPGTTLNLLKFPVMNPTAYRTIERNRRLRALRRYADAEEQHRRALLEETGDSKYALLQGLVDRTEHFEAEDPAEEDIDEAPEEEPKIVKPRIDFAKRDFAVGRWCFDTPGTVHREQIINYLSLDELIKTVPRSMIVPRTFSLGRNETLFIGGLARIDHLDGPSGNLITVFASDQLPVFAEDSHLAYKFYKHYVGTAAMAVPYGDKKRLSAFPPLKQRTVKLVGTGFDSACADVTLSSTGWITVTTKAETELDLAVWTPGGTGIFVRRPSLHPFIATERGVRHPGTNAYETKPIRFPSEKEERRE